MGNGLPPIVAAATSRRNGRKSCLPRVLGAAFRAFRTLRARLGRMAVATCEIGDQARSLRSTRGETIGIKGFLFVTRLVVAWLGGAAPRPGRAGPQRPVPQPAAVAGHRRLGGAGAGGRCKKGVRDNVPRATWPLNGFGIAPFFASRCPKKRTRRMPCSWPGTGRGNRDGGRQSESTTAVPFAWSGLSRCARGEKSTLKSRL